MSDSEGPRGLGPEDPITVGGLEIIEILGRGGMGIVYKARQPKLERIVVLKVLDPKLALDPDQVKRFLREARSAAKLRHPNMIQLVDVGTCPETHLHFLACEYVDGETLDAYIKREGKLDERDAYEICFGLAGALSCAEENGIIHRDVKPENILLTQSGRPKLSDLGLAKRQDDHSLTVEGTQLGSPHYLSPELAMGERLVDIRGDIYSLGITLYQMLTGALPYDGKTFFELAEKHITEDVPDPCERVPDLSADAATIVRAMCARDPDDRYPTAEALERDLARVLSGCEAKGAKAKRGGGTSIDLAKQIQEVSSDSRPPTMPFEITVCKGGVVLAIHAFDRDQVVIGRSPTCDVHIDESVVSRRHAQVTRTGMTLSLTPLSKTNPTAVNEEVIESTTLLQMDDTVTLAEEIELLLAWTQRAEPPTYLDDGDTPVMGQAAATPAEATPEPQPEVEREAPEVEREAPEVEPEAPSSAGYGQGFTDGNQAEALDAESELPSAESPYAESPYAESPGSTHTAGPSSAEDVSAPTGSPPAISPPESTSYLDSDFGRSGVSKDENAAASSDASPETRYAAPGPSYSSPTADSPKLASGGVEPQSDATASQTRWVLPPGYVIHQRAGGSASRNQVTKGFQFGRSSLCDVRLPEPAPRKAALIVRCEDCYQLWNVSDDPNAVTVNGEAVFDQAMLEDGDEVVVFGITVTFEQGC